MRHHPPSRLTEEPKQAAHSLDCKALSLFAPPSYENPPQLFQLHWCPDHYLRQYKAQELDTARIRSGADSIETVPSLATSPLL